MTLRTGVIRRITCSIKYKVIQPGTEKNDCHKLEIQQVQIRKEGKFASINYRMPVSQLRICLPKKYMQSVSSDARNGKNLYSNI